VNFHGQNQVILIAIHIICLIIYADFTTSSSRSHKFATLTNSLLH